MGAWEWIPTGSFGRKCSIPTGSEFCTFSQTLAFPQNPRERLQRPSPHSQHWVVLSAFLLQGWCRGGGSPSAPPGPLHWPNPRPHPSWDFPLWQKGGEMGKVPSAAFPTSQQCQEQQVAEDAWTARGCLVQSSFASNCTQATRFLPCRRAFGMQPLHPVQLRGCPAEPMDGGWRWESEGRAAPNTQVLAQHLCNVSLPAPANRPCFAEPQGSIIIAKPPVAAHSTRSRQGNTAQQHCGHRLAHPVC